MEPTVFEKRAEELEQALRLLESLADSKIMEPVAAQIAVALNALVQVQAWMEG